MSEESVLFCTPCYGGMVTAQAMKSAIQLKEELTLVGLKHDWLLHWNDSLVHRARMEMTASFLETEYTHQMWFDADIEFNPEDFASLWNLNTDIAVGVYAMKRAGEDWFAAWKDGKLIKDLDQFDGTIEVDYAGTGFMLIKRHVIEKLTEIHGTWEGKNGRRVPAIYMTPIHDDTLESEDYHFCRIARDAGFKITMEPRIRLKHWGQYAYGSNATVK